MVFGTWKTLHVQLKHKVDRPKQQSLDQKIPKVCPDVAERFPTQPTLWLPTQLCCFGLMWIQPSTGMSRSSSATWGTLPIFAATWRCGGGCGASFLS